MLSLSLNSACRSYPMPLGPLSPLSPLSAPGLLTVRRGDPRRAAVEAFVRRVYAQRYGADVRQFAPSLLALLDA